MKNPRSLFLLAVLMLLGITFPFLRNREAAPNARTASGLFETVHSPPVESVESLSHNGDAASIPEEVLTARILAADANDSSATEIQRRAFAALQKGLAQPTKEALLEKAERDPARYHVHRAAEDGKSLHNPAHGFAATFDTEGGIEVRSTEGEDWTWRMEALDLAEASSLSSEGATVEWQRSSSITEWYVNEERGLEQFFRLDGPIAENESGESRIRLKMETRLSADLRDRDHLVFRDADGEPALHYHGLEVIDAKGNPLPSRMELEPTQDDGAVHVALVFNTRGATFPVTVDPFVSTVLHRFPGVYSSNPRQITQVSGSTFVFVANDGFHGSELWKSDGTAVGTELIKDINSGGSSSSPRVLTAVMGTVFFQANDGDHGNELWKTDLTAAGTELVKDIDPGTGSGVYYPPAVATLGGKLHFTADDGVSGEELWSSDGTSMGTNRVKDINFGPDGSSPGDLVKLGSELFFSASDGTDGVELWKTDGTGLGTELVKNIHPAGSSTPKELINLNGELLFSADDGSDGVELWKSNGTLAGTVLVKDILLGSTGSNLHSFTAFGGDVFFFASDGTHDGALWKTNGTTAGTTMVKDIYPGGSGGSSVFSLLTATSNTLFFFANDGVHGFELWKSDGTGAGTTLVKDIYPGLGGAFPNEMLALGSSVVVFPGLDDTNGTEFWRSDGTEAGTYMIKDLWPGTDDNGAPNASKPVSFAAFGGTIYFAATGDDLEGEELWTSDGTSEGTVKFKNLNPNINQRSEIAKSGNHIYFTYNDEIHGSELWASDGTPAGTGFVKDIWPGEFSSGPSELTDFNGTLFFEARDNNIHGLELWKSNGTAASTVMVKDIWPGVSNSAPDHLTVVNGTLFFAAKDEAHAIELWKSDGTAAGTVLVKDIDPNGDSTPEGLADLNGLLVFSADDGVHGRELWKSDGTEAGTVLVKDIDSASSSSISDNTTGAATPDLGLFFFAADDGTHGNELWKSDGTEAGTQMVKDIEPGSDSSDPEQLTEVGLLFFEAFTSAAGRELWISEGDNGAIGTFMLADINPGPDDSNLAQLTSFTPKPANPNDPEITGLVFLADDGTTGLELWASFAAVVFQIQDLNPGAGSGFDPHRPLTVSDQRLIYPGDAGDGVYGNELYGPSPDGLLGVPILHEDLVPGSGGSYPSVLIDLNGQLIWFATDGLGGFTLRTESGTPIPDGTIGKNLGAQKGNDVYNTSAAGQKQTLVSKKLKRIKFHGKIGNDGDIADRVQMTGNKGNKKIQIKYFGPAGNVTGLVTGAGYELTMPPGDSNVFRVEMKPKRKLKIKKTGKIKRKTKTANLTAKSLIDPAQSDKVQCKGKTK